MEVTNNVSYQAVESFKRSVQTLSDAMEGENIDSAADVLILARNIVDQAKSSFANAFGLVTAVAFDPGTEITLTTLNETEQLDYAFTPIAPLNAGVTFVSSEPTYATVSATGLVTALTNGTTVITITTADGSFTDTVSVVVDIA